MSKRGPKVVVSRPEEDTEEHPSIIRSSRRLMVPELRASVRERVSNLRPGGLPLPGKTTQGFRGSQRSSSRESAKPKSFRTVRNFWRRLEASPEAAPPPPRRFGPVRKILPEEPKARAWNFPLLRKVSNKRESAKRISTKKVSLESPRINEVKKASLKATSIKEGKSSSLKVPSIKEGISSSLKASSTEGKRSVSIEKPTISREQSGRSFQGSEENSKPSIISTKKSSIRSRQGSGIRTPRRVLGVSQRSRRSERLSSEQISKVGSVKPGRSTIPAIGDLERQRLSSNLSMQVSSN